MIVRASKEALFFIMNLLKKTIISLIIALIGFYLFRFRVHPVLVLFLVFGSYYYVFKKKNHKKSKIEDAKFRDL